MSSNTENRSADWRSHRERSNPFMLWLLCGIALHLGRFWARLILYPTALYYLLAAPAARTSSQAFLNRALARSPSLKDSLKHFFTFGQVSLDRLFFLANRVDQFDIQVENGHLFDQFLSRQQGGILICSHLGSFEAMRILGQSQKSLSIRILLHRQHNSMAMSLLERLAPDMADAIIDAGRPGPEIVLSIDEAVKQGQWVGIMADRASPEEMKIPCQFLGAEARFPAGPWLLAATLKVPVILCFGLYEGKNRYRLKFEQFSERLEIPRSERMRLLQTTVQDYADKLAAQTQQAPYNWFNFYDFWRH